MTFWQKKAKPSEAATRLLANGLSLSVAVGTFDAALPIYQTNGTVTDARLWEEVQHDQFQVLLDRWKEASKVLSNPDVICSLPEYRAIVAMGIEAVPRLASELAVSPNIFLLSALEEITGDDPVSESDYGDVERMVACWLDWLQVNEQEFGASKAIYTG